MSNLSTTRTPLDSFIYWATFIVLSCFVTFFLNSMIELANAEEHQYDVSTKVGASRMHTMVKSHRASTSVSDMESPDTVDDMMGE